MPATIQELRPDAIEKATAFATGCGCRIKPGRVAPALSLGAFEGDALVAVLLCVETPHRHRLELGHAAEGIDAGLRRTLIDKALMKLHAAGIRTCDLATNGGPSDAGFWHSVSWIGQVLGDAAA